MDSRIIFKHLFLLFLYFQICRMHVLAADSGSNNWGSVSCGAQSSVRLVHNAADAKAHRQIDLLVEVRNVSQNTFYVVETVLKSDFQLILTLPSGKEVKVGGEPPPSVFRRISHTLNPQEAIQFRLDLRSLYQFTENGQYQVIVKRKILLGNGKICEVTSNALKCEVE